MLRFSLFLLCAVATTYFNVLVVASYGICDHDDFTPLAKVTPAKAVLCPMVRDEVGFLSEWVAYYQIHGFHHIFVYDDQSRNNSLAELQPWVDSGFVTIKSGFTVETLHIRPKFLRNTFLKLMAFKRALETDCKRSAAAMGYDYFISLDVDEYLIPIKKDVTIVDELVSWGHFLIRIPKFNYQASPHILEPIDKLTIEAYENRMHSPARMNYYTSVSDKIGLRLNAPYYTNDTVKFFTDCCNFHGCNSEDIFSDSSFCKDKTTAVFTHLASYKPPWRNALRINHYARSFEKFVEKGKTWAAAGVNQGKVLYLLFFILLLLCTSTDMCFCIDSKA